MNNQYILIKGKKDIFSPELNAFFKGLLGNNIEIIQNEGITILHSYNNKEDIKDALLGLVEEYEGQISAYI